MRRTLLIFALALAAVPAAAAASSTQLTVMQDDSRVVKSAPEVREATLDEMKALGADVVKITIAWREIAPGGPSKPAGFDGATPAEYGEAWVPYETAINGITARGMRPLVSISGPTPDWASERANPPGVQRPDPAEYQKFVQAVGTKFPQVTMWSIWNEPNLPRFLLPQRQNRIAYSPRIYRNLLYAGDAALNASGHGADPLLIGEMLPVGRTSRGTRSSVPPLEFLRELACADEKFHLYKGSAAKKRGCTGFKRLPGDGLAYHPYTLSGGPGVTPPTGDDASIGQLSRVTQTLDKLSRRFQKSRMPLYLTEFGFQSDPPDRLQTPIKKIPGFMGEAEYLAFRASRVKTYSQYPLVDDQGLAGFQSGLRFTTGTAKPKVYEEFQHPIFVRLISSSRAEVFGALRDKKGGQVQIESAVGSSGFKPLGGPVTTSAHGYFRKQVTIAIAAARRFRFSFDGGHSRDAKPAVAAGSRKKR